jgi:hypothetical protein
VELKLSLATDNPVVGHDLQERKHAPPDIGLKGVDLRDFHPLPPGVAVARYLAQRPGARQGALVR